MDKKSQSATVRCCGIRHRAQQSANGRAVSCFWCVRERRDIAATGDGRTPAVRLRRAACIGECRAIRNQMFFLNSSGNVTPVHAANPLWRWCLSERALKALWPTHESEPRNTRGHNPVGAEDSNFHYEYGARPERGCVRWTSRSAVERLQHKSKSMRVPKFGRAPAGARRRQPRSRERGGEA